LGIDRGFTKLLMHECLERPFQGKLLTAGKQDIFLTPQLLNKCANEMGFSLIGGAGRASPETALEKEKGYVSDVTFFCSLGFDNVDSLDHSDYENCSIVHDLNKAVPDALWAQYDVVMDTGTSEHIFDFPEVLANYHRMLKVGGRIIHCLPTSNHVNHGFYMMSPTLLVDYYSANNWEIQIVRLLRLPVTRNGTLKVYEYDVRRPYNFPIGFLNGIWGTYLVAQKSLRSTFDAPVQQKYYWEFWARSNSSPDDRSVVRRHSLLRLVPHSLLDITCYYLPSAAVAAICRTLGIEPGFDLKLTRKY
jgi:hypothetical protein